MWHTRACVAQAGLGWADKVVSFGALTGILTSLMGSLLGQARIYVTLGRQYLVTPWLVRQGGAGWSRRAGAVVRWEGRAGGPVLWWGLPWRAGSGRRCPWPVRGSAVGLSRDASGGGWRRGRVARVTPTMPVSAKTRLHHCAHRSLHASLSPPRDTHQAPVVSAAAATLPGCSCGLLPAQAKVNPATGTPRNATFLTMCTAGVLALFLDIEMLSELVSIGTLVVFAMVCLGVLFRCGLGLCANRGEARCIRVPGRALFRGALPPSAPLVRVWASHAPLCPLGGKR